jgi:hypothetical protein
MVNAPSADTNLIKSFSRMTNLLANLEQKSDELIRRLEPIKRSMAYPSVAEGKDKRAMSPLCEGLEGASDRIQMVCEQLSRCIESLDI